MSSKRRRTATPALQAPATGAASSVVNGSTNDAQDAKLGDNGATSKDSALYDDSIGVELAEQIERVQKGTFPKVVNAQEALLRELERKIAIADRYRKLQIKNVNELYESEVVELKARFEVCNMLLICSVLTAGTETALHRGFPMIYASRLLKSSFRKLRDSGQRWLPLLCPAQVPIRELPMNPREHQPAKDPCDQVD
jgi:hypothetical protein